MKRFYLNGIHSFENKGIDAIVRSTAALLKKHFGEIAIFVPSENIEYDQKLWPNSNQEGIFFLEAYSPKYKKIWQFLQKKNKIFLKKFLWPFPFPRDYINFIETMDIVLSVGGDNYSSEYGFPSFLIGTDKIAIKAKKPTVLWGASIGPFFDSKDLEFIMAAHLSEMSLITTRESCSETYAKKNLFLKNTLLFPDSAFSLEPEEVNLKSFWPQENEKTVIGINLSPYLNRFGNTSIDYIKEMSIFIDELIANYNCSILLIPHVIFRSNTTQDDLSIMKSIFSRQAHNSSKVSLLNEEYNSAQLKYIIGNCNYFIGARTHSTIAAFSSYVPTISIGYSVKSKGINKDLFGHTDYVIDTSKTTCNSLMDRFKRIVADEIIIKEILVKKINIYKSDLSKAVSSLDRFFK